MIEVLRKEMFDIVNNDIEEGSFNEYDKMGWYEDEMWLCLTDKLDVDIEDVRDDIKKLMKELDEYIDNCNFWDNPQS